MCRCILDVRNKREESDVSTYDDDGRHKHVVHEEVTRLREPRRLALKSAAILVEEVWIE